MTAEKATPTLKDLEHEMRTHPACQFYGADIKRVLENRDAQREAVIAELLFALNSCAHPDGILRGPLIDGPELDQLNDAKAKAEALSSEVRS